MHSKTKLGLGVGAVLVAAALFQWSRGERGDRRAPPAGTAEATPPALEAPRDREEQTTPPAPPPSADEATAVEESDAGGYPVLVRARWGSGAGALGRERPQEGNPEGPMSLVMAGKELLVLDQVNGRLARYDERGKLLGTTSAPTTAQDLAVGSDGTVAMLDRLADKTVTLVGPSGKEIAKLPLEPTVEETGLLTGIVVDGKDVYAEKEHGALVLLGTTDGRPAGAPAQLQGRPSKDGALLLTAGLSSAEQGRAYVNAFDRKADSLRFARAVQFPPPAYAIVLLDSDASGMIYLGVAGGGEPGEAHVACLDPGDGHVVARVALPLSHTPEESFRDFSVGADGTIVFAVRTEDDVEYRTARCLP